MEPQIFSSIRRTVHGENLKCRDEKIKIVQIMTGIISVYLVLTLEKKIRPSKVELQNFSGFLTNVDRDDKGKNSKKKLRSRTEKIRCREFDQDNFYVINIEFGGENFSSPYRGTTKWFEFLKTILRDEK